MPVVRERKLTPRGTTARQRIVEGAAKLIHRRGVARVNLDDIMEATGASRSQLYHYFSNKQDLVREVIAFQTDRILAANSEHLGPFDSYEGLRAWGEMTIAANRAGRIEGCPLGSLASELSVESEEVREQIHQGFVAWSALIESGLRRMKDRGRIDAGVDVAALAVAFLATIQGGILLSKVAHDSRPLELAVEMALEQVRRLSTGIASSR